MDYFLLVAFWGPLVILAAIVVSFLFTLDLHIFDVPGQSPAARDKAINRTLGRVFVVSLPDEIRFNI